MRSKILTSRARTGPAAVAALALTVALVVGVMAPASATNTNSYRQHNLVSDQSRKADLRDTHLVNAWGLAFGTTTPAWVVDAEPALSTLYRGANGMERVSKMPLVVTVPGEEPTGAVFNDTKDFFVHDGRAQGAARFIFVAHDGKILGWSPDVPPMTQARLATQVPGAEYLGVALAKTDDGNFLYAADFHNARIDVFNHAFKKLDTPNEFVDPDLPAGYAPFNVQNLRGRIYVAYAKQDAAKEDEVAGAGLGFVDVYRTDGHLVRRLASHGTLNAPWGMALAPNDFGAFSGALLVGNFGDGHISAFDRRTGAFMGLLHKSNGHALRIDGLWALKFGNGVIGTKHSLMFTAGPDDESHGLFGMITAN
jgi:uncharacterized protein (TIGR03118 family)